MSRTRVHRKTGPAALGVAGVAFCGYAVSVFQNDVRPAWLGWVHQVVPIVIPAVAAAACAGAARRAPDDSRRSWILLATGAGAWALGDTVFTILDRLGRPPAGTFDIDDAFYLALIPLWCAALLLHPARRGVRLAGSMLNVGTVFVAAASLALEFAIIPIVRGGENVPGTIVALAYPVGDLAMVTALLAVIARMRSPQRTEGLIALAIAFFLAGDIVFARQALDGSYVVGSPVDLTWILAFIALAVASRFPLAVSARPTSAASADGRSFAAPAVLGFIAVGGLSLAAFLSPRPVILLIGALAVALLVSMRLAVQVEENRRLVLALGESMRRVEDAGRAREEFVAAASHQLRTPLTSIRLRIDELRVLEAGDPLAAEYVEEMDEQIAALQRMTTSLLALLSADRTGETRSVGIRRAIDLVLGHIEPVAEHRGVRIAVDGGEAESVVTREGALEEVLLIALDNAVKYGGAPGSVRVGVMRGDGAFVIDVADDGPGMDEDTRIRAFDPFFRSARAGGGFGLGLAIAKRICDAAGATIALQPKEGGGTVCRIAWPLMPPAGGVTPGEGAR